MVFYPVWTQFQFKPEAMESSKKKKKNVQEKMVLLKECDPC